MSSMKTSDNASVRPKIRSKHSEKLIGEPLERTSVRFEDRDGIERYYPALHIKFSHSMVFHKYFSPPMKTIANLHLNGHDFNTNEEIQRWIASVNSFEEMIKTLLRLQHNQFWSTLIYERSLQICLESYLRSAPRAHDLDNFLITDQMKVILKRVYILVFKLYLRICSFAESKTHFMSDNTFASLIYDNYLIDVPKIIDLCVLYGHTSCRHLMSRMLSEVIRCQPRYEEDLLKGLTNISEALNSIQQTLGIDDNRFDTSNKLAFFQWSELQSIVCRITDISVSLQSILQSLPQTVQLFRTANIDKCFIDFYNRVFPSLQNELNLRLASIENNDLIVEQNKRQLLIARSHLIQTFRNVIQFGFLDKLMDQNIISESKVSLIDEFIETLTLSAFERSFITDYCSQYPLETDLSELSKHSELTQFEKLDKTRVEYFKSVIKNISSEPKPQSLHILNQNTDNSKTSDKVNGFVNIEETNGLDVELESRVQYIQEIMPELGNGFVIKCLEYYDLDNEKVLNAILEDNLPPHLSSMDRSLQKVPKIESKEMAVNNEKAIPKNDSNEWTPEIPQVIDERHNIYNNDEFDIFRNKDIDLSRIHFGKKEKTQPKLDDKTKDKIMSIHYKNLEDEENQEFCYYDDEYDDTYEDDTKIDLITDKLMDELDVKTRRVDTNDDNKSNKNNIKDMPQKSNFYRKIKK